MFEFIALLFAVGLGIGTAALAKRYNRDPGVWGVFGALLFIIALPLLLLKGPLASNGAVAVGRRTVGGPHLPAGTDTGHWSPAMKRVVDVLDELGSADFDAIAERGNIDENALAEIIDRMLERDQLDATSDGFTLLPHMRKRGVSAPPAATSAPSRPVASPIGSHPAADNAERLRRLRDLHADGLLSNEEFEAKRRTIVDDL